MSSTDQNWEQWEAMPDFRRRAQKLIEKHRSIQKTSTEEYLAKKRSELALELEGKKLIYLDTNHWVNLCHTIVQNHQYLPVYNEILRLLETQRQKGHIYCPVSFALFEELMKQNDITTRQATARIMDLLSGGVCLRNWVDIVKEEFARYICRVFHIDNMYQTALPIWTKASYWAGEHTFEFPELTSEEKTLREKVYIDLRWGMTIEEYQSMPGWIPTPDVFATTWLEEGERAKASQTESRPNFETLIRQRRRQLLCELQNELVQMLALCHGVPGSPDDHITALLNPIIEGREPNALPFVEVVAGLDAVIAMESTRKVQANDMLDYLHAAQSIPYCDAVFCDNFMAQKMRNRPLEFGRIYQTEIGSRPEEIVAYLKGLAI